MLRDWAFPRSTQLAGEVPDDALVEIEYARPRTTERKRIWFCRRRRSNDTGRKPIPKLVLSERLRLFQFRR